MRQNDTIIEVRDLRVSIRMDEGLLTPVRGVDFAIHAGETLGLVGESGCGKSLTSKAILRINDKKCVSTGQILFQNENGESMALPRISRISLPLGLSWFRSIDSPFSF